MNRLFSEIVDNLKSNFIESDQIFQIILMFQKEYLESTAKIRKLIHSSYDDLKDVNSNAEEVVRLVNNSSEIIKHNIETSKNSIGAMNEAAESVNRLDEGFNELKNIFSALTQSIAGIIERIDVIEDISELTNLLALNAAIEAARAGEKGKGFQVVAKEVRNLADRSRTNTTEITEILHELNSRLDESRRIINNYGNLQSEVLTNINDTNSSLSTSTDELELINREISSIDSLVEKQAESTASLLDSLELVNSSSDFTIKNAPFIDKAVNIYKETNTSSGTDLEELVKLYGTGENRADAYSSEAAEIKVLTVGHDIAYPPWCYIKDGKSAGISVEKAQKTFRDTDTIVQFKGGQWSDIYDGLLNGSVDVIANVGWPNSVFDNDPVEASSPYDSVKIKIFGKSDEIFSREDLRGKRIGVQKGSFAEDVAASLGCTPVVFENDIQGMVHVLWNNIDGVATEERVGEYISGGLFMNAIKAVSDVVASLDVVFLVKKGSPFTSKIK